MTTVTTPAKVARNLTRSLFEIGHIRCNSNDRISMSEICARELRATLLGNQPDWKPTHETTYQHTRRRCDGRRRAQRARAGFEIDHSEPSASRVAISRTAGPDGAQKTSGATSTTTPLGRRKGRAAAETTRRPLHPLRGTAPVMGRCTRYEPLHPIRRGALPTDRVQRTQSQEQTRNPRDNRRHAGGQLLMLQTPTAQFKTVAQGANLDGPNGERTGRPGRGCRGCRETGK